CRVPRRATAARAGCTGTAPVTARRWWSARPAAPGTRPSRCPAARPSTRAGMLASLRYRAARRATAARAGTTQTAPATRRRSWPAKHSPPIPGRTDSGYLGDVGVDRLLVRRRSDRNAGIARFHEVQTVGPVDLDRRDLFAAPLG